MAPRSCFAALVSFAVLGTNAVAGNTSTGESASSVLRPLGAQPLRPPPVDGMALPPPLDRDAAAIGAYWTWLKAEAGAPATLAFPRIEIAPLPRNMRAAFAYPSVAVPDREMRVILSPRSIDRAAGSERLVVLGELAHELTHYVFLLSENGWNPDRPIFRRDREHHCDPEFQRLNLGIADILWRTYHSRDTTRAIRRMVELACWSDGRSLVETRDEGNRLEYPR